MTSLTSYDSGMAINYSIYEAKARFSEVIRQVREGKPVTVSYRGEPVAEIRPIKKAKQQSMEERVEELERSGVLIRSAKPKQKLRPVAKRPGALARFLAERGE